MFMWLLQKKRITLKAVLTKQHTVDDDHCPFGCNGRETVDHFALHCSRTNLKLCIIWALIQQELRGVEDILGEARRWLPVDKQPACMLMITLPVESLASAKQKSLRHGLDLCSYGSQTMYGYGYLMGTQI